MQPKVSIIVPVYNSEKYIERCINSLRNQTLKDIEIILINDSSTDSTPELCRKANEEDDRIILINQENAGAGLARNSGLLVARGEYIGFVDSDDYVEEDMFEKLYEKAKEYDSDLVLSGVRFVDGNMFSEKGKTEIKTYFDRDTHFETEEELKKLKMGIVGSMPEDADDSKYGMSIWKNLFRHQVITENSLAFRSEREVYSEDALFMVDFISHIKKATGIKEAFYNYCRNGESVSKSYNKERFEKSLVFVSEVEKRFKINAEPKEYKIYINRFWQAMCRVLCSQEIVHGKDEKIKFCKVKKRLKEICTHSLTVSALKEFPIDKLPLKQRVFAMAIKYRLYFIMKILVGLRNR